MSSLIKGFLLAATTMLMGSPVFALETGQKFLLNYRSEELLTEEVLKELPFFLDKAKGCDRKAVRWSPCLAVFTSSPDPLNGPLLVEVPKAYPGLKAGIYFLPFQAKRRNLTKFFMKFPIKRGTASVACDNCFYEVYFDSNDKLALVRNHIEAAGIGHNYTLRLIGKEKDLLHCSRLSKATATSNQCEAPEESEIVEKHARGL